MSVSSESRGSDKRRSGSRLEPPLLPLPPVPAPEPSSVSAETSASEPERRDRVKLKRRRQMLRWRPDVGRRMEVKPSWERTASRRFSRTEA